MYDLFVSLFVLPYEDQKYLCLFKKYLRLSDEWENNVLFPGLVSVLPMEWTDSSRKDKCVQQWGGFLVYVPVLTQMLFKEFQAWSNGGGLIWLLCL